MQLSSEQFYKAISNQQMSDVTVASGWLVGMSKEITVAYNMHV